MCIWETRINFQKLSVFVWKWSIIRGGWLTRTRTRIFQLHSDVWALLWLLRWNRRDWPPGKPRIKQSTYFQILSWDSWTLSEESVFIWSNRGRPQAAYKPSMKGHRANWQTILYFLYIYLPERGSLYAFFLWSTRILYCCFELMYPPAEECRQNLTNFGQEDKFEPLVHGNPLIKSTTAQKCCLYSAQLLGRHHLLGLHWISALLDRATPGLSTSIFEKDKMFQRFLSIAENSFLLTISSFDCFARVIKLVFSSKLAVEDKTWRVGARVYLCILLSPNFSWRHCTERGIFTTAPSSQ